MAALSAILGDLPGTYRDRLSAITIEHRKSQWIATLSYALYTPTALGQQAGPYSIAVDGRDLPPGVTLFGWERIADSEHALAVDGAAVDPESEVLAMLREVHASGVIGALDIARFDSGGYPHWIAKTHAGSDAERRQWLLGLRGGSRAET